MNVIIKLLLLLSCAGFVTSCILHDKDDCCTVIDIEVDVIVKNKAGQNLLDAATDNHYVADDIRLYYLKDSGAYEVYQPNLDAPRHFSILQTDGETTLRFSADWDVRSDKETTVTLLQWRAGDNTDIDTIYTEMTRIKYSSMTVNKVTYKNKVVYDASASPGPAGNALRLVEIVK